jgi:hypothetical protein
VDETFTPNADDDWEAGFEGGRCAAVSRVGPFVRVFPRPAAFVRRFYHSVHELPVHEWTLHPASLRLGPFCAIDCELRVRYQATVSYVRDHLEFLPDLDAHLRGGLETLLKDAAEQEIRKLEEDFGWLEQGFGAAEKAVERAVHETLAVRDIQSRARCRIEATFQSFDPNDPAMHFSAARYAEVYREALRIRHEARERLLREQNEQAAEEYRYKLEREERLLAMAAREEELRKARQDEELERLRADLAAEEARLAQQRETEARQREEQIRHDARLRNLETEAELKEKDHRAKIINDMGKHLQREIELLAMERQRLTLEEEIREVKLAKARGWVVNAKKRFPLGEAEPPANAEAVDIPKKAAESEGREEDSSA